ncbi:hypothetical protein [Vibrio owensii]|uniref:hypothetical protein n=1 Tax=Vibrio owensii TaxID=696485 RepID=UPI0022DD005C|nr:hypothetical protein [Vibrio owensii]MDA0385567.1 hypothetical protein [Vibrio owensii]
MYSTIEFSFTLSEFIASPSVLPFDDARYVPPTPEQVQFLQHYLGLSLEALCVFLGDKDALRSYDIDKNGWRRMLYAAELADVQHDIEQAQLAARQAFA